MQITGTFKDVLRDINGNMIISFNVGKTPLNVVNIEGKQLDIKVTQHREKRTLTQNAYYWQLLSKLSAKLRISNARLHNLLLRECASPFIIDGKVAMQPIPDTDSAENEILEASTFHLKPTSGIIIGNDSTLYRWYLVLRGSSTFSTAEFTVLLNRLIEDCKGQGIETLPPDELEKMRMYAEELERGKSVKG